MGSRGHGSLARLALGGLVLLAAPAGWAAPAAQAGLMEQRALPAWSARREAAEARVAAARAYFEGEGDWARAFPELVDAPLTSRDFLRVRAEALRAEAVSRAAERLTPAPEGLSAGDARRWMAALRAAVDAEDAAAAAEGRFLAGVAAGLDRAPGLQARYFDIKLNELSTLTRLPERPDDGALALAVAAGAQADALRVWRRAAVDAVTRVGSTALSGLVAEALAAPPPLDGLDDPVAAAQVAGLSDRLLRVAPLLDPAAAAAAAAWVSAADEALYGPALAELSAQAPHADEAPRPAADVRAEIAEVEAALAEADAREEARAGDPGRSPRSAALDAARRARLAARLDRLRGELETSRALTAAGVQMQDGGAQVAEKDRLAAEALELAGDTRTATEAAVRKQTADLRAQIASEARAEAERRALALDEIADWRNQLDARRSELAAATLLGSLSPERQPRLDAVYLGLRDLSARLHRASLERDARARELAAQAEDRASVSSGSEGADASEALMALEEARADLAAEHRARAATALDERDVVVDLEIEAKIARRECRALASDDARLTAQRAFFPELASELASTPLTVEVQARQLTRAARGVPSLLTDLAALTALVTGSVEVIIALLAWSLARRAAPEWISEGLGRLAAAAPRPGSAFSGLSASFASLRFRLGVGALPGLAAPLSSLSVGLLDVAAALVADALLAGRAPLVSLALTLWISLVAWRTLPRLIDVLLATPEQHRLALRVVTPSVYERAHRSLRWLLRWRILANVLTSLTWGVLVADRAAQTVHGVSVGLGVALAVWLLHLWAEDVRQACAAEEPGAVTDWAATPGGALLRLPRTAVGLVILAGRALWQGVNEFIASRAGLRWLAAAMARRRLATGSCDRAPVDPEVRARIAALPSPTPPNLDRAVAAVVEAHARWTAIHRRGAVAVVGDRGSGIELLSTALPAVVPGVTVLRVPRRMSSAAEVLGWLGAQLDLPGDRADALVTALAARPSGPILVLDAHLLLLRTVGGFAGLRALFEVMQTTSEEHFWVVAVRAPMWRFLEGAPGAIDLGLFGERVDVGAARAIELAEWLLAPLEAAGIQPSFRSLAAEGSAVDARAEHRSRAAWFRLVEDLSQGAPMVARELWLSSLCVTGDAAAVEHNLPSVAGADAVEELGTEDLFLLTALALHGELDQRAFAEVLNRPIHAIGAACRRLEALGVLRGDEQGDRYVLGELVHPQVLRVLRQRAFIETA